MALCYFYGGDLDMASYFKEKHDLGICEKPDSGIRKLYMRLRQNHQRNQELLGQEI